MNDDLIKLLSFWSAFIISSEGEVILSEGIRSRFLSLLNLLNQDIEIPDGLVEEANNLSVGETLSSQHPVNLAMLRLLRANRHRVGNEFSENLQNIEEYFETRGHS